MDNDYREQLVQQIKVELRKNNSDFSNINKLIDRNELLPYAVWTDKSYTRVCLFENTIFELILICWNPGATTSIHDHDDQNCSVFFFDGDFEETIYCENGKEKLEKYYISKGSTTQMKKGRLCHALKNRSDRQVMTLHLYNAPIKSCRVRKNNSNIAMEHTELINDFVVEYAH